MIEVIKKIIAFIKDKLADLWGVFLSVWTLLKLEEISKATQLIIFLYVCFLFWLKIEDRYLKHKKKGKIRILFGIFRPFLKQNKSVKYLDISENAEKQVDNALLVYEKVKKGGFKLKAKKLFNRIRDIFVFFFKANPRTSSGNLAIIGMYSWAVYKLIEEYNYVENGQPVPNSFYYWLGGLTLGFILAIIGNNSGGWESIKEWAQRINSTVLNRIIKKIDAVLNGEKDVADCLEDIKESLPEARKRLELLKDILPDKTWNAIRDKLDRIEQLILEYEAELILKEEQERQRKLELAKKALHINTNNVPSDHHIDRGMMR